MERESGQKRDRALIRWDFARLLLNATPKKPRVVTKLYVSWVCFLSLMGILFKHTELHEPLTKLESYIWPLPVLRRSRKHSIVVLIWVNSVIFPVLADSSQWSALYILKAQSAFSIMQSPNRKYLWCVSVFFIGLWFEISSCWEVS